MNYFTSLIFILQISCLFKESYENCEIGKRLLTKPYYLSLFAEAKKTHSRCHCASVVHFVITFPLKK